MRKRLAKELNTRTYLLVVLLFTFLFAGYALQQDERILPVFKTQEASSLDGVAVVPMGMTIGVRINTDGVMVLGTGTVHDENGIAFNPSQGKLLAGDLIISINDTFIESKEMLAQIVAESQGDLTLAIRRDDIDLTQTITPVVSVTDGVRRLGAWVRDSTKGIGTLTFFDPQTQQFGALGHGIMDVDTKLLMSVKNGTIMPSSVTSVKRGMRGAPGELEGTVDTNIVMGAVTSNHHGGIFGTLDDAIIQQINTDPLPVKNRTQIQTGPASILTNALDEQVQAFDIQIENINRFATDETKGMVIRITDPALLEATGGIVQGMSGSPILQNGHIIGAITHVFVQDPTKGYGIFIENMLRGLHYTCIL